MNDAVKRIVKEVLGEIEKEKKSVQKPEEYNISLNALGLEIGRRSYERGRSDILNQVSSELDDLINTMKSLKEKLGR